MQILQSSTCCTSHMSASHPPQKILQKYSDQLASSNRLAWKRRPSEDTKVMSQSSRFSPLVFHSSNFLRDTSVGPALTSTVHDHAARNREVPAKLAAVLRD